VIFTFANGTPDTITIDGNSLDVDSNPFTFGPLTVGEHTFIVEDFDGSFTIGACPPPTAG
jgi:hypothetical protein